MQRVLDLERLKEAMRRRGFSQAALAQHAGVSPAAIQQILNGSTRRSRALPEIANSLGVTVEWLQGAGPISLDPASKIHSETDDRLDQGWIAQGLKMVPYIRSNNEEEDPSKGFIKGFPVSSAWLSEMTGDADTRNVCVVRVSNDSMSPLIRAGDDLMIVFLSSFEEHPDTVWAITYKGAKLFRRLMRVGSDVLRVIADDPLTPYFDAPVDDVQIDGRVVWVGRRLRS